MTESHPLAQMEVQNLPRSKEALAAVTPSTILQSFRCLARSRMYYFQPPLPDTHTDAKAGRSLPESTYSFQKNHSARRLQKGCAASVPREVKPVEVDVETHLLRLHHR